MTLNYKLPQQFLLATLILTLINLSVGRGQQQPKNQSDDVIRVSTDLIQTAVTVLDKDGRFVDGLKREQFELLIDGSPRPISFFEQVSAGNPTPERVASGKQSDERISGLSASGGRVRGRTVVFFIDDLHLSADSLNRTRQMLRHFLQDEMNSKDFVAIASASGQIGFLQQFTHNKQVLNAAVERLVVRQYDVRGYGTGNTKMREFDALIIDKSLRQSKDAVLNYYIRECIVQTTSPKTIPIARAAIAASCETQVRNSARAVLMQAAAITQNMYASLESLMRSSARAPGRKLAFFISDGFLMDAGPHSRDLREKLDHIIDSAQRSGVVIYTIDSRGLVTDRVDVTQGNARLDFGAPVGEIQAYQDAMHALAEDTGGRALRNTNYFDRWVGKVLDETSNYYLVAWRPQSDEEKTPKFRHVKVNIVGRPELTVRAPRGYMDGPQASVAAATLENPKANSREASPEASIRNALADYYPSSSIPTILSLTYLNTPKNGSVLTSSIQISSQGLKYGEDGEKPAQIKLAGVVLTDQGRIAASFKNQLNVNSLAGQPDTSAVIYNEHTPLAPGIYQVRVAVRDERSGRVGSAMDWIVIPDLTRRVLSLSSVLLGGQVLDKTKGGDAQVQLSVDHRFARSSHLGYWIFVYNARRDAAGNSNLTVKMEILRDGRLISGTPPRKISDQSSDPDRIPFGEEFSLQALQPDRYDLRVTVVDNLAGTNASQSMDFEVR